MSSLDIGAVLAVEQPRDIETITGELLEAKRVGGEAILTIGRCLIEAKKILPHGEWLPWLNEKVEYTERTAQRFMRLAQEYSNPTTLSDLGASKALALLALPPEERDQFMSELHVVDGEEKAVVDMSARQLEQVIKERDEARLAAEHEAANAKTAEESRAKMESEMAVMKGLLESAQAEKDKSAAAVTELEKQLAELREAPVDVAVMAVDQAALDKAKAEAAAEMQEKLDKAKKAKVAAEEKLKAAEESLANVRLELSNLQNAQKREAILADADMATFEVLFNQAQEVANKLQGVLLKLRGRGQQENAAKLQDAMNALADMFRRAAE